MLAGKGSCEVVECKSIHQNALFNYQLNFICIKQVNKRILAHLNINSLIFVEFVKDKVDILMISETKIEESLLLGQFKINGFNTPCRLARNRSSGGIIRFDREDISALKNLQQMVSI